MHRTQLLRLYDRIENVDREQVASHDAQHSDHGHESHDVPSITTDGDKKESKPPLSLRTYWLWKNMSSLDGLPGLLTAPDAILYMAPQSNFDKDGARPMLRDLRRSKEVDNTARDRKWFAPGFVMGAVTIFAITRIVESLKR